MASSEDLFTPADSGDTASAPVEAPAAAPARKRARRATTKAAAPAPAVPAASDATPEVTADSAPADAAADAAPADAKSAPAKKTAKKAAAKKATTRATATKTAAKATTKKAAAKRTSKKAAAAAAPEPLPEELAPLDVAEADLEDEAADELQAAPAPDTDAAEPATAVAAPAAEPEPAAAPAIPATASFGVLFQAPDTAAATPRKRGSRRATAAQAAPEHAPPAGTEQPVARGLDVTTEDALEEAPAPRTPRRRGRGAARDTATVEQDQPVDTDVAEAADEDEQSSTSDDSFEAGEGGRRRRRRGGKGRGRGRGQADGDTEDSSDADRSDSEAASGPASDDASDQGEDDSPSSRRRRRRRRSGSGTDGDDPPGTVTRVRESRRDRDEPQSVKGSTRLEAKKQRRREGREAGRRRTVITEAEFLARRESVERVMVVRERDGKTQIGVLEDDVLVEHYVSRETNASMAGNVYLGRVQNVLPSMEAAFVDIGKGRNAVLYAGEVNWDAAGLEGNAPKRIENALKSGDSVLVQVTKDPIGHKGARLTSQISLPGRYLVYVPEGSMTGISRKLPDTERSRLKGILKEVVPDHAGVIVRTAAEGASEDELRADVERLTKTWEKIKAKAEAKGKGKGAPLLVHGEPDLTVRVIRDVFNEDFSSLVVAGSQAWSEVSEYLGDVAPDLAERLQKWTSEQDLFTHYRVDEQIAKAMDRKVWLPSGGSLVIDRTEAMTVVDVNTGKFIGSGGNLEETVTKNNIEAAEEIVRQLRLRDIGGIIVIDFIDMVLESNRDLVVRRLLECLGRDRTKHQVAEVTSLGLVQMTRKRVGSGLIEVFSENCEHCAGRGIIVHADPVEKSSSGDGGGHSSRGGSQEQQPARGGRRGRGRGGAAAPAAAPEPAPVHAGPTPAQIAAAAHAAALKSAGEHPEDPAQERDSAAAHEAPEAPDHGAPEHGAPAHAALTAEPEPQPVSVVESAPEPERVVETVSVPVSEPEPVAAAAPRRRKRGRVVAPAGPPRGGAGDEAADPETGAGAEQS